MIINRSTARRVACIGALKLYGVALATDRKSVV